jgi:hypothetical protein
MARREPKKLSDYLKKSVPVLGRPANSFAEAYPSIESMIFRVTEQGEHGEEVGSWTFDTDTFRGVTNCSNDECTGGGVNTANILRRMVFGKISEFEHGYRCIGREKDRQRVCLTSFDVKVTVKYRDVPKS